MKKTLAKIDGIDFRHILIIIIFLFLISSVLHSVLACFPKSINVFPDEIRYFDISRSLRSGSGIIVHNVRMNYDQILYPLFLIPFSFIKNQTLQIEAIGIAQAVVMSSVVFPVFLLGKKILKNNSVVILLTILVLALPDQTMSSTFMSENLFYPISAWFFYFIYRFWDSEESRERIRNCIVCAVLCILAYFTKAVAAYLAAAFVLTLVFDCRFTKKGRVKQNIKQNIKQNRKYILIFCLIVGGIVLGYKLVMYLSFSSAVEAYANNMNISIYNFNTFMYFFYAAVYNLIFALIAFFYFPVVMPLFRFRKLNSSERNLLIFAVFSLVIMILITTYTISLNEDYPKLYIRQHTRYYAPLLIVFLTLFLKQYFVPQDTEAGDSVKPITKFAVFTAFFCATILFVFRFFSNVCIDGVLLQTLSSIGKGLASVSGNINEFSISWQSALVRCLMVLVVLAFTVLLAKEKTQRIASRVFVVLILAVCVANNYYSMQLFNSIFGKPQVNIDQAITVDQYFNNDVDDGNILIITNGYKSVLETYFTKSAYWAEKSKIVSLQGDDSYIDLTTQKIESNYPSTEYSDLDSVEYIITDGSVHISEEHTCEVHLEGVTQYHIYVNTDASRIYLVK